MAILHVRISMLNRRKKTSCFRETSMLVEYQLYVYLRQIDKRVSLVLNQVLVC